MRSYRQNRLSAQDPWTTVAEEGTARTNDRSLASVQDTAVEGSTPELNRAAAFR
jgi:hypothetical protein